ncbi:hypothetical protein SAMN04488498_12059 [Mesorhizobium albiziae]|uniref:Uncharacterized protein n=1 Tax=Neomesorhizobium albiziae TaxID=335020 RepID=A0A1I4E0M1_9HYPH|nr:hypothetical protein [Mesorhizobium albiziae]GLS32736.1 hypothetical protein GCM10007937_44460 [Mesorhizobium albiziae]SFK97671.1 hypothetical protein SAMN04488498_12059 [Mesorhizobium albiziae]
MNPPPPLIDQRFVAGFLLGPLLGAILHAAIAGVFAGTGTHGFFYYLATSLAYGYATSLFLLLPAFLVLRHYRLDLWPLCVAVGLATGYVFYLAVFRAPTSSSNMSSLLLFGIMPFLFIACSIRLIAGRRA